MLTFQYNGEKTTYAISFSRISEHIVRVDGLKTAKTKGFSLSNGSRAWDYSGFKTIYKTYNGGVMFSDNGDTILDDGETSESTLEALKAAKIEEMNNAQQIMIAGGMDVELSTGVEHFTLTAEDQLSLMELQALALGGATQIPWHTSDHSEGCKFYSAEDFAKIGAAATSMITYHVTYFRDLRRYISSLRSRSAIDAVRYGMEIPDEFKSDVLKQL